jgi:hypothetical protein
MANQQTEAKQPEVKRLVHVLVNRESQIQIATTRERDGTVPADAVLFLNSGWNLVDEERWAQARKNPGVQSLLKQLIPQASAPEESPERVGHPVLVEGRVVQADDPLGALSESEALRFVAETFVTATLQKLEPLEQRAPIKLAIRAQIDKIEKPKAQARAQAAK